MKRERDSRNSKEKDEEETFGENGSEAYHDPQHRLQDPTC